MLAARFPYVTPSGHVGECARANGGTAPIDQLVDGGYLENTGLGTINDLSDIWLPQVRKWNTDELQKPQPKLIVPLVAYLDNATGTDKNAPKRDIANEFLLPPLAKFHAGSGAIAEASLQRASDLVARLSSRKCVLHVRSQHYRRSDLRDLPRKSATNLCTPRLGAVQRQPGSDRQRARSAGSYVLYGQQELSCLLTRIRFPSRFGRGTQAGSALEVRLLGLFASCISRRRQAIRQALGQSCAPCWHS
jgi:hypothetical protein